MEAIGKINKQKYLENITYVALWLLVFIVPFISQNLTAHDHVYWPNVWRGWIAILPFLVIFILNNFVVAPLFFAKKYWSYFTIIVGIILLIFILQPMVFPHRPPGPPARTEAIEKFFSELAGKEAYNSSGNINPYLHRKIHPRILEMFYVNIVVAILLVGFNMAVKLMFKSMQDEQTMKDMERHRLQSELEYLKVQINPHFFMNMLNNIHALVDIDQEKAKMTIIQFSKLMRYILYDANQKNIELDKEVRFIRHYIQLMRIRYTDKVNIEVDIPENLPEAWIPPLLFVSFIENAFKHGVSYRHESFVRLTLTIHDQRMLFELTNSYWPQITESTSGGIGLENTRKRLELIYKNNYVLTTGVEGNFYRVCLEIPV